MELLPFNYQIPRGSRLDGILLHLDENDELSNVVGGHYKEHRRTVAGGHLIVVRSPVFVQRPAEPQDADKAGNRSAKRAIPFGVDRSPFVSELPAAVEQGLVGKHICTRSQGIGGQPTLVHSPARDGALRRRDRCVNA